MDFPVLVDHRVKIKEKQKQRQVFGPSQRIEKAMKHEGDSDNNCN